MCPNGVQFEKRNRQQETNRESQIKRARKPETETERPIKEKEFRKDKESCVLCVYVVL